MARGNFAVPVGWSGPDRRFGESIKENLDILTGTRGDPLDRAITARDLIASGIATLPRGANFYSGASNGLAPANDGFEQLDIPPAPTNLQANGAFENILLTWDLKQYKGHAFTQIYRHTSDDIANATLLGQLSGYTGVYADQVGESSTYYYWVKAVNNNGEEGPFNASAGTLGQTAPDVTFLLNKLSNAITSSELAQELSAPISAVAGIQTDITSIEEDIIAIDTEISNLKNTPAWASGTAYVIGDLVSYSSNLYSALTAHTSSSSNAPDTTPQDSTEWKHIGAYGSIVDVLVQTETTKATLQSDYITTADSNTAIAAATQNLASTTDLNNALGNYTTTASLQQNYYTKTSTDSAISTATQNLASTTDLNNALGNYTTTASLQQNYYTKTSTDSAISGAITTLSSGFDDPDGGSGTVTLQQAMSTQATLNGELKSSYTIKIDTNGAVAGYGLASTANSAGNITSEFIVNADRFAIMRGGSNTAAAAVPFVYQATSTTLNGETVPAGVYMADAFIKNGSIASAKIGELHGDKITAGTITSNHISSTKIDVTKLNLVGVGANINLASSSSGARMVIQDDVIQVYDSSGTLRVKLGNLS